MNASVMKDQGRQEALKQWGIVKHEYPKAEQPLAMIKKHIGYRGEGYPKAWLDGFIDTVQEIVQKG